MSRHHPHWPLVVAYGTGLDSTAILIEFANQSIRPALIPFADTGGENSETYAFLETMNAFLTRVGFPETVVVRYRPRTAPYHTLEGQCLHTGTLPSIAATAFVKLGGGKDGMDVPPTLVDENSELGEAYLRAMHLAGRYAYAGREPVARHIATKIPGAKITDEIHNHHNFAWKENHFGEDMWVVRKGATPTFPGQKGCH